jgi:hypothetical protein
VCRWAVRRVQNVRFWLTLLPGGGAGRGPAPLVAIASELLAWMAMLALDGPARAWEPKRLRLRLFSAAGRLVRGGRRLRLRLAVTWPWASHLTAAISVQGELIRLGHLV